MFQYIAILFAAAFVLLLFTYIMDRRQYELIQDQNQAQIDDLLESASAVQRLDALYEENAALKNQIEELESQLEEANNQLDVLPDIISNQEHVLSETWRALDRFWQIDEAYVRGRYSLCRELIQEMEDDKYGNSTGTTLSSDSNSSAGKIVTSAAYSDDGTQMTSQTDANGSTTNTPIIPSAP